MKTVFSTSLIADSSFFHFHLLSIPSFVTICHSPLNHGWAYTCPGCTHLLCVHIGVCVHQGCQRSLSLSQGEMARERLKLCLVIMKG